MARTCALVRRLAVWTALTFSALACGGSSTPTASSSPAPGPPPLTLPGPSPTPSPSPSGGQNSLPSACSGPLPSGDPRGCGQRPRSFFQTQVQTVVDSVRSKGSLILYDDLATIRNLDEFRKEVNKGFNDLGICVLWDYGDDGTGYGDEVNLYSRQDNLTEIWQMISSRGQVRSAGYMSTCEPAIPFPAHYVPDYPVQDPQCSLPPSGYTFCLGQSADSLYSGDVRATILQVQKDRPQLFDFTDCLGELSCRLTDPQSYIQAVIDGLRKKGYCAIEVEELAVKRDNSFNENFDIVRTPEGRAGQYSLFVYKGKCQNALF